MNPPFQTVSTVHTPESSMSATEKSLEAVTERVRATSAPFTKLVSTIHEVVVGQDLLIRRMLTAMLADGHLLIEGVPGLAKTLAVSTLAKGLNAAFQRIQFTPDLLPADVVGTLVYRPQTGDFIVHEGPIFANIVLADEINRAPAKVQSALLEAMQERQVTIGRETHMLPSPFMVLATQNPIEQEGTYPLPEAQVDRFLMKVIVTYPNRSEELEILKRMGKTGANTQVESVIDPSVIVEARKVVDDIYVDDRIAGYIVDLVTATREPHRIDPDLGPLVEFGASPRATLALTLCARANAFIEGRGYVVPQDVKDIALDVLRHRVATSYEAEAQERTSEDIVRIILDHVPVP
jgi:MoxR-like ATPase